jgi:hypothetical protein
VREKAKSRVLGMSELRSGIVDIEGKIGFSSCGIVTAGNDSRLEQILALGEAKLALGFNA